ncbi:single-stranded DNA-binding protein [Actinoplanes regularis]|uniref:Single-strand DNA-binding protein n=1 Tax=Actinoplanes regularis TaxID=52697 RepID=A0A238XHZ6_9ACTN|nr:single-stranded DNA-binding protein [Actinoplanes regularis]GIE90485.1 hypothetical protein Are01nite_69650 [Actinoplanes regularis]SNR58557.1 single-strand DNA-binding protein [Actinoplanes regularis]
MLFTVVIEGRLTSTPATTSTRDGREFVQMSMLHKDRYRDQTGKWQDARPMFFDVLCWGELGDRVRNLVRGDQVVVEAGQLLPYINDSGMPAMKMQARNVSVSMRYAEAHAGPVKQQRRGDLVVTADGERYAADAYPETSTDRELVHNRR